MPNLLDVWLFEEGENGCFQPDLNGAETKEVGGDSLDVAG